MVARLGMAPPERRRRVLAMRIDSSHPLAALAKPAVIQPTIQKAQEACWLPLQTPNTSNRREHWAVTAKRAKSQRSKLKREVGQWLLNSGPRLVVTVTRVGPRRMDPTNLGSALKSVVDGIADALKVDDGAEWLEWRLEQAKGPAGVRWKMHWFSRERVAEPEPYALDRRGSP